MLLEVDVRQGSTGRQLIGRPIKHSAVDEEGGGQHCPHVVAHRHGLWGVDKYLHACRQQGKVDVDEDESMLEGHSQGCHT